MHDNKYKPVTLQQRYALKRQLRANESIKVQTFELDLVNEIIGACQLEMWGRQFGIQSVTANERKKC